jgi:hypothetical protein
MRAVEVVMLQPGREMLIAFRLATHYLDKGEAPDANSSHAKLKYFRTV